jgi:hypothetical protein
LIQGQQAAFSSISGAFGSLLTDKIQMQSSSSSLDLYKLAIPPCTL